MMLCAHADFFLFLLHLTNVNKHLFKVSAHMYRNMIDLEYEVLDDVVSFFSDTRSFC
jgi:hypothetical protein